MGDDPARAVHECGSEKSIGCSGWVKLSQPNQNSAIKAVLDAPLSEPMNLVLAIRTEDAEDGNHTMGCFSKIRLGISAAGDKLSKPRGRVPENRQRARELQPDEIARARLATEYLSKLPLLLFPPEGGLYLRPSKDGPVVAALDNVVPPFVQKILGKVEIADDEASPFEFAMAVALSDRPTTWGDAKPQNCIAFSGWTKVERKFQLHDIKVELEDVYKYPLTLQLAIRLPSGSDTVPASSYWRKIIIAWED